LWIAVAGACDTTSVVPLNEGGGGTDGGSCPPADLGASCPEENVSCDSMRGDGCPIHVSCFVQLNPPGYWLVTEPTDGTACGETGKTCDYSYSVGDNCPEEVTIRCDASGWTTIRHVSLPPCSSTGGAGGVGGG
jgi:hypothetical protein